MLVWLESRVTDVGIRTDLELQSGTLIITPKTFHLTIVDWLLLLLIVLFHVLTHNRDSSVNRPISNCIMIADNNFKNRVHKFTAYAVCS